MRTFFHLFFFLCLFLVSKDSIGQMQMPIILNEKDRAAKVDEILEERLDVLLPELMRKHDIQMWVIISREYNEDPLLKTMLPSTWLSARRRTILLFFDPGNGAEIEKVAIARYDVGKLLKGSWDLDVYPDQWDALIEIIKDRNPKNIGINISDNFGLSDGLVYTEHKQFMEALPQEYHDKVISAEPLAISWLETRSETELNIYPTICRIGHQIINEGLSEKVIHPGITSTDDVVWWLRDRVRELGLDTWFHPTVSIQGGDPENFEHLRVFSKQPDKKIIKEGDLLHVDFGITYLRLSTDQQQHFYVLKKDETEVPDFLVKAFARSNRLQDILTSNFKEGRTGNEILKLSLDQANKEGLNPSIYTHPIGLNGHAAGPAIGMWDKQQGVPGNGDYPLYYNTAYSIELNTSTEIPEWNKVIRIMLEEDGYYDESGFHYIDGRQRSLETIPRKPATY